MSNTALWIGTFGALLLYILAAASLVVDGAYLVVTGRPPLLPFERIFRRRNPATELDCVRLGAQKLLQALSLILISIPSGFVLFRATADLTGVLTAGTGRPPPVLDITVGAAILGGPIAGLALAIVAYQVGLRIKHVPLESQAPTT